MTVKIHGNLFRITSPECATLSQLGWQICDDPWQTEFTAQFTKGLHSYITETERNSRWIPCSHWIHLRIELTYQLSKFSFSRNFHVLLSWWSVWLLSNHQNWFLCDFVKNDIFPNCFSYHIFAIYVGGASSGLPTACTLIAVSGARLPSVDGLVVRCITSFL